MIRAAKMSSGAILLLMAATAAAQEGPVGDKYSYYVALGDSYSSGVGATTTNNDKCITSLSAWPYRVEADIGQPSFVHAACSGAIALDITGQGPKFEAQGGSQISFLPSAELLDGALITIQVGGNDLLHEESITKCIAGELKEDGSIGPLPEACKDVEAQTTHVAQVIKDLGASLEKVYGALRAAAPKATIVAVGYPHVVSTSNADCDQTLTGVRYNLEARQKLNALVDAGNAQIKLSARNAGIGAITDEIATAFEGHEACSKDEWIVSPEQLSNLLDPVEQVRVGHPNDVGHQALAEVVLTLLPSVTTTVRTEEGGAPQDGGVPGEPGTEAGGGEDGE